MRLIVHNDIKRALSSQQSASKRLTALIDAAAQPGKSLPPTWFKPSGQGRTGTFEPYRTLGLHHAKLDHSGQNGGDPLLVFQKVGPDIFVAVALTTHEDFATSDHDRCRRWLWDNRASLDWTITEEARILKRQLDEEFGGP